MYSCIITFSESSDFILEVVDVKYGREFIFLVFQNLGNWRRRLHSKFSNVLYHIKQTFEENMSSGTTAWQVSKYGVFSGSYFLVFGLNNSYLDTFHTVKIIWINISVLGNILKRKTKIPQKDFSNFTGNFNEFCCFLLLEKIQ